MTMWMRCMLRGAATVGACRSIFTAAAASTRSSSSTSASSSSLPILRSLFNSINNRQLSSSSSLTSSATASSSPFSSFGSSALPLQWCRHFSTPAATSNGAEEEKQGRLILDLGRHKLSIPFTKEVNDELQHALAGHADWMERSYGDMEQTYKVLLDQLRPLRMLEKELRQSAEKSATVKVFFGWTYLIAQFGLLARLTWWEFSWDIMEPITYFISFGTGLIGYTWFLLHRREYSYDHVREILTERKFRSLCRSRNLDMKQVNHIVGEMTDILHALPRSRAKKLPPIIN